MKQQIEDTREPEDIPYVPCCENCGDPAVYEDYDGMLLCDRDECLADYARTLLDKINNGGIENE